MIRVSLLLFTSALFVGVLSACTSSTHTEGVDQDSWEQIHEKALVLDAHTDIEIPGKESRYVGDDGRSQVAPDKMRAGQMDAIVMSIAVSPMPRTEAGYQQAYEKALSELNAVLNRTGPDGDMVLVRSATELNRAHSEGQLAAILGFQNALILGESIARIDEFYDAGVRVFALTHMGHNAFADSSRPLYIAAIGDHEPEAEHGGLSDLGRQAITRLNDLGVIVDITQLSKQAALEVLALSRAPVIASHSNVRALTDVSRNLSDEEIDRIGEIGGVIHIAPFRGYLYDSTNKNLDLQIRALRRTAGVKEDYYYPFELYWEMDDPEVQRVFLASVSELLGPGSVDAMMDHIDYIKDRIGVDHVGIGTDFNHGSGLSGYADASDAPNITRALLARGYSAEEVGKIWGGNFLRVFQAAEDLAKQP